MPHDKQQLKCKRNLRMRFRDNRATEHGRTDDGQILNSRALVTKLISAINLKRIKKIKE